MIHHDDTASFNLKQLNEEEVKEQYLVTIKHIFAALEDLTIMGASIEQGTLLERTSTFRSKRVLVFVTRSIINYGLMRNV
jgi:formyltetrahydrofolate hydrolase